MPVPSLVGSECASCSTPLCLCCTKSVMDESDNLITSQNLYVTTLTILLIIMFYYFKDFFHDLLGHYTLYTFQKINFLSCNKFHMCKQFLFALRNIPAHFQLLTTKTLLLKLNCQFFSQSGKYNLLFVSFLLNGIIKGTSKEPSSNPDNCSCTLNYRDKLDLFPSP